MLCQEMNDFHFLSQESCMTGAFACFQSGLRTCFAITYTYIGVCERPLHGKYGILTFIKQNISQRIVGKQSVCETINQPPERRCTYMIPYKATHFGRSFEDCQNKLIMTNISFFLYLTKPLILMKLFLFLLLLIFTLLQEDLVSIHFIL